MFFYRIWPSKSNATIYFTFKKPLEHIIKGDIDGKYMFSSEHKYLVAKICPRECYLEVKGLSEGKMDGCIGFGK